MSEWGSETFGQGLMLVLFLAYSIGGFIGAVYWAVEGELLSVVLSIFIPFYGAVSVLLDVLP